jgi:UreE urease accessory protein, N-terminal domain
MLRIVSAMIRITAGGVLAGRRSGICCDTDRMLTVNKLIPDARGLAPALVKRAASVELDWDVRQRSRFDATDSAGRARQE